jgi:hypothetical protein
MATVIEKAGAATNGSCLFECACPAPLRQSIGPSLRSLSLGAYVDTNRNSDDNRQPRVPVALEEVLFRSDENAQSMRGKIRSCRGA